MCDRYHLPCLTQVTQVRSQSTSTNTDRNCSGDAHYNPEIQILTQGARISTVVGDGVPRDQNGTLNDQSYNDETTTIHNRNNNNVTPMILNGYFNERIPIIINSRPSYGMSMPSLHNSSYSDTTSMLGIGSCTSGTPRLINRSSFNDGTPMNDSSFYNDHTLLTLALTYNEAPMIQDVFYNGTPMGYTSWNDGTPMMQNSSFQTDELSTTQNGIFARGTSNITILPQRHLSDRTELIENCTKNPITIPLFCEIPSRIESISFALKDGGQSQQKTIQIVSEFGQDTWLAVEDSKTPGLENAKTSELMADEAASLEGHHAPSVKSGLWSRIARWIEPKPFGSLECLVSPSLTMEMFPLPSSPLFEILWLTRLAGKLYFSYSK